MGLEKEKKSYYFLGICGTAMASCAVAMKRLGYDICGSDEGMYPPMSDFLKENDVKTFSPFSKKNILSGNYTFVIGNAISRGNLELEEILNKKLEYISMPELLKKTVLAKKRNLLVSGTHGKTTTASLLAWILEHNNKEPSYLIGGLPKNLGQGGKFVSDSDVVVMEGDEYDSAFFDKRSKFLHYAPEAIAINNIEFDHADIYDNIGEILRTFSHLVNIVPSNGAIFYNGDDENCKRVTKKAFAKTYAVGLNDSCDYKICEINYETNKSFYSLDCESGKFSFEIPLVGEFNIRNAVMATLLAKHYGLNFPQIQEGLNTFLGVARRQDVKAEINGVTIIDDFAHHPSAIEQVIESIGAKYSDKKLWVVFEPRSNTTQRNIFQEKLPLAFQKANEVIIANINDNKKIPIEERLDFEKLSADICKKTNCKIFTEVKNMSNYLVNNLKKNEVLLTLSNGSLGGLHDKLILNLRDDND